MPAAEQGPGEERQNGPHAWRQDDVEQGEQDEHAAPPFQADVGTVSQGQHEARAGSRRQQCKDAVAQQGVDQQIGQETERRGRQPHVVGRPAQQPVLPEGPDIERHEDRADVQERGGGALEAEPGAQRVTGEEEGQRRGHQRAEVEERRQVRGIERRDHGGRGEDEQGAHDQQGVESPLRQQGRTHALRGQPGARLHARRWWPCN